MVSLAVKICMWVGEGKALAVQRLTENQKIRKGDATLLKKQKGRKKELLGYH